ncbi:MAG: ECF RNA polymerase sigma factor SigK [Actinocatenispora sp.]
MDRTRRLRAAGSAPSAGGRDGPERSTRGPVDDQAGRLLIATARGDEQAFAALYDLVSARVYGLVLRVLRDPAQAEEVTQEVFLETWRGAGSYDPARGAGASWILTLAHRRAVDRVRSAQSRTDREHRAAATSSQTDFDEVADQVTTRLEHQQVRRCLSRLTELQRESVQLAYYTGRTYREVAQMLDVPVPTVKTRIRDALIRLRDCLEVAQ